MIEIKEAGSVKLDRVAAVLAGVPGGTQKAISNALKRAGDKAKTEAGTYVAEEYTLSKGDFMKRVTVFTKEYGGGSYTALSVTFKGAVIPLIEFKTQFSKGGTLTAQVKRGGGGEISRAFAARVYGPMRIFERVGSKRLPVEQKYGPSPAQMVANEVITEKITETVKETFDERIEQEVWRLLSGIGR